MKKHVLFTVLLASALYYSTSLLAQSGDKYAYVITDANKDGASWTSLRKLDLQKGTYSDILFSGTDASKPAFDAASKAPRETPYSDLMYGTAGNAPFGVGGVAAIALDKKNNRLFYTPMFENQMRYIDLKTMNTYFVENSGIESLTSLKQKSTDQSNIITRMVIASDGNGYALSNDANSFLMFTTGKTVSVTNLGAVTDAPGNAVSCHNGCSSFGGDMIADDDGNLYVFTAGQQAFKINIASKTATHLGTVKGIPSSFTINGAAVDGDNQIVITSAMDNTGLYTVDIKTMVATKLDATGIYRSSDLASDNLLAVRNRTIVFPDLMKALPDVSIGNAVTVYPNPVTDRNVSLQFNAAAGKYTVQVKDVLGRQTTTSVYTVNKAGDLKNLTLPADVKPGVYLISVYNSANKSILSKKVVVE